MRWIGHLATLMVGLMLFAGPALADKRVALVIGNGAYQNVARLDNPGNDASAMAATLRAASFEVTLLRDLGVRELRRAVGDFGEAARDADMAVVYFAGHGIEVGGVNYLIPTDAVLARDFDVEDEALSLDRVLRAIESARKLRFVILDACRDNPFASKMARAGGTRSVTRGLARVEPTTSNTLVAFATEAGTVAADGAGGNSPFAAAMVKHLLTPGLDIRIALGRVRDQVMRETGNRQRPYVSGSLGGDTVAMVEGGAASPIVPPVISSAPPADPCALAATHWRSAEAIATVAALEDHRKRFPNCSFALLAEARIAALQTRPPPATPPLASPSIRTRQFYYIVGLEAAGDNFLALRSEPTTQRGARLKQMGPDTLLEVIGRSGDWYQVRLQTGETGWAFARYIACCKDVAEPARPASQYYYIVGLDPAGDNFLALRSQPTDRGNTLIKRMGPDTLLSVIARQGDWSQVRLPTGETGWAASRFLVCCKSSGAAAR